MCAGIGAVLTTTLAIAQKPYDENILFFMPKCEESYRKIYLAYHFSSRNNHLIKKFIRVSKDIYSAKWDSTKRDCFSMPLGLSRASVKWTINSKENTRWRVMPCACGNSIHNRVVITYQSFGLDRKIAKRRVFLSSKTGLEPVTHETLPARRWNIGIVQKACLAQIIRSERQIMSQIRPRGKSELASILYNT